MEKDFHFLTFSIFNISNFRQITDAVKVIFQKELESQKAEIYSGIPNIKEYINPKSGGYHLPKFCCWKNSIYPNHVFFISNYEDGLSNICRTIQKEIKCSCVICSLSGGIAYPFYKFYFSDSSLKERLIQVYKEDRWVFYEEGEPLSFENLDYYKNKLIKKRLNNSIIEEYLFKMGIDIFQIDTNIIEGFTFLRKEW